MANENLCWFCRENAAQEQFTVKKTLYDPKSRRGGSFGRMRAIDVIRIDIPRCRKCASIQNRINLLSGLYLALLITMTVIAGFLGYRTEIREEIPNLSIYVGIGTFILGLLFMFPFIKLVKPLIGGSVPLWTQLPEITEWINKGWTIHDS